MAFGYLFEFLAAFFYRKHILLTVCACWKFEHVVLLRDAAPLMRFTFCQQDSTLFRTNADYYLFDLRNCSKSAAILDRLNRTNALNGPSKYLLLTEDFPTLKQKMNDYRVLPSSEIIIATFHETLTSLKQPYKTQIGLNTIWENYGNFSGKKLFEKNYEFLPTSQRRHNLEKAHMSIPIYITANDTWNHLTNFRYPRIDAFAKADFPTILAVLDYVNITYTLEGVPSFGYYNKTSKKYSGIVNGLLNKNYEISGSSMSFTEERYQAVDFLKMGNPLDVKFLVRKPSTSYIRNIFWITFHWAVWLSVLVTMIIFAGAFIVVLNWETRYKAELQQDNYTFSDAALITFEAVCQQGTMTEPRSITGRILTFILFAAFMFVFVSYSANIVVLLQSTKPLDNLEELLESRIEVGGQNLHYMKHYFEQPKQGILKELYLKKIYPDNYYPFEIGMKKLQMGSFAFHVEMLSAYDYISKKFTNYEVCGLQELKGYLQNAAGYIPIQKKSAYKEIFQVALLKVNEFGLQQRNYLRIAVKPKCYHQGASFKSVGIYDCYNIFVLWIYGFLLSISVLIGEIVSERIRMRLDGLTR